MTRAELAALYGAIHADGVAALREGRAFIDPAIVAGDTRRSLGLYFHLPDDIRSALVQTAVAPLAALFDALDLPQLVYMPPQLHTTFLEFISAEGQFDPEKEDVTPYRALAEALLPELSPVRVEYRGLALTPGAVIACGYPETALFNTVRHLLRAAGDARGLRRFERRALLIFHSTLVRWQTPFTPDQAERLIAHVEAHRDTPLAAGTLIQVRLQMGRYLMVPEHVHTYASFTLSGRRPPAPSRPSDDQPPAPKS